MMHRPEEVYAADTHAVLQAQCPAPRGAQLCPRTMAWASSQAAPMWNRSGGWTSREVPTCPPAPVPFSLSLQILPPDLYFPSPSHKYSRSNS